MDPNGPLRNTIPDERCTDPRTGDPRGGDVPQPAPQAPRTRGYAQRWGAADGRVGEVLDAGSESAPNRRAVGGVGAEARRSPVFEDPRNKRGRNGGHYGRTERQEGVGNRALRICARNGSQALCWHRAGPSAHSRRGDALPRRLACDSRGYWHAKEGKRKEEGSVQPE